MSTTASQPVGTPSIETSRWRIDPTRSSVEFRTPTFWGLMTVKGRFVDYDGTLELSRRPAIELTIDAASLDTNNRKRDAHLRSSDFFDVQHHPRVRFLSESATLDGEELRVVGRLHAAGRSMPLELIATLRRVGDELEVEARTHTDHAELGMSRGMLGMIKRISDLLVRGRLVHVPSDEMGGVI